MTLSFDLPEEASMMRQAVRDFAEKEIAPIAGDLDEREEFSPSLTKKMGDLGLLGVYLPEEYGGSDLSYLSYIIAVEELARIDGSQAATIAAHNSLGIGPIYYFGSNEQKEKYLPQLTTGEKLWGFGLTEPEAGSDAGASKTKAVKEGDLWVINGSKNFITNGSSPASLGVTVQTITGSRPDGKKEYTCFLVDQGTEGFEATEMHRKMMWRASITSELFFTKCKVPESQMLGKRGEGFHQMLDTLDKGRLSIAAMGLGCAVGAYELALEYARQRTAFGRKIATFQANAFKLADMATEIEAARNLLYKATWLYDQGRAEYKKYAAMSKLYCSEVANRIVNHAVQIHGGYGLMKEYPVERFYRDQKLLEIGEGTSEIQRLVIARYIGCYK
ncbi:acyl-CoA dehydrogenase [Candidatus Heimdallarchaeota archaeon B3_Heim]|nr:MAG: acyl-CoA dehydrogenase [Candidatus Heimdallarchaeota archaeon B3_Heim]